MQCAQLHFACKVGVDIGAIKTKDHSRQVVDHGRVTLEARICGTPDDVSIEACLPAPMNQKLSAIFQVATYRRGTTAYAALSGELDIATVAELERALIELESIEPEQIILDLGELAFMDVTGLRIVLVAAERARQSGIAFSVTKPQANVRRLFQLTEADQELDFSDEDASSWSS